MAIEIENMPAFRLGTVRHVGAYHDVAEAFERLHQIARASNVASPPGAALIAVYHDNPETTPPDKLRSDAGVAIPEQMTLPAGLIELRLPAGRYAHATHRGPYAGLSDAWARLRRDAASRGDHRITDGPSYEIYGNTPAEVTPDQLRTDLYLPVE